MNDVSDSLVVVPAGRGQMASAVVALACVLFTALALVYCAHKSRQMFASLEALHREENRLQIEWRQLLVERSALAAHARVETIARQRLDMRPLDGHDLVAMP